MTCKKSLKPLHLTIPDAAQRFGFALIEQAEFLGRAPEIGVSLPERPGSRFFPFRSYLIIYRAQPKKKEIQILRIWHGARGKRPSR